MTEAQTIVEPEDDELGALRALLATPEMRRLDELEARLDDPARLAVDIARALPAAAEVRQADGELHDALQPSVKAAITYMAQNDPDGLADVLYPVMGPAIRSAISGSIRRMVESFNLVLQNTVSAQAMRWRVEAWRTGRPFAEVVLLRSLVYRVEQVFLIARGSGMLIAHVAIDDQAADPDMVSGMLSALRDYVHDSFDVANKAELSTLAVGELTVWVEPAPAAFLAAVIRGNPPPELREDLALAMRRVQSTHGTQMADFDGDPAPFESAIPDLESCLQQQTAEPGPAKDEPPAEKSFPWRLTGALLLVLALIVWLIVRSVMAGDRLDAFVDTVAAEPGVTVTSVEETDDGHLIKGLRDPLATDLDTLRVEAGYGEDEIRFAMAAVDARIPAFTELRARTAVDPPDGARVRLEDHVLHLEGQATERWANEAKLVARGLPGVDRVDSSTLLITDGVSAQLRRARLALAIPAKVKLTLEGSTLIASGDAPWWWADEVRERAKLLDGIDAFDGSAVIDSRFTRLLTQVQDANILFESGSSSVESVDDVGLSALALSLRSLSAAIDARGQSLVIEVVGETDASGDPEKNSKLQAERAESAIRLLRSMGAPDVFKPKQAQQRPDDTRRVRFAVLIDGVPVADSLDLAGDR